MTRRCPACHMVGDVLVEATAILRLPVEAQYANLSLEVVSMIEFNDDAFAMCPAEDCEYTGPLRDWS